MAEKGISKDSARKAVHGLMITIGPSKMDDMDKEKPMGKMKCPHCGKEFEPKSMAPMDKDEEENE